MWCHHLCAGSGRLTNAPRWRLAATPDKADAAQLAASIGVPLALATILVQRGYADPAAARAFLRPRLDTLADPLTLAGMADAVDVIGKAVRSGDRILVHGDYDVDGQCAAAVLTRVLRVAGADVHAFLPHRMRDGYDFGAAGLAEAARLGARLIVTCDCGISAVDAVQSARAQGFDIVVTDHHLPGSLLPPAHAVVDPQRADDQSGLGMLCGTGVVFKLSQALTASLGLPAALPHHLLDYVALATVADVVPLVGENRTLVKYGLRLLAESRWPGLQALVSQAGLTGELRATQVGFILAPRLNAVGRIADANDGLRLLLTDSEDEAKTLAARFDGLNQERQALDQQMVDHALSVIDTTYADPAQHAAIVVAVEGWHPGVVGIVASRVVERYGRPAFMIGLDGDTGRGSGRSIDGFDLHHALTECGDLLERYGGHRMAAGLSIRADRVAAFRERLNACARAALTPEELGPTQRVDVVLTLAEINDELEQWSRRLEPCGMGNPGPVFGVRAVQLLGSRVVGRNHLKTSLTSGSRSLDAIAFNWADRVAAWGDGPMDAAVRLERNEWNGRSALQARAVALGPSQR